MIAEGSVTTTTAAKLRFVLVRLTRTLRRDGGPSYSASLLSAMASLEEAGPLRVSQLATLEGVDPSVATRVVASLESQGLVERTDDPDDKRASLITLSKLGRRTLDNLWHERTLGLSTRLSRLSAKERQAVEAALPALEKLARDVEL